MRGPWLALFVVAAAGSAAAAADAPEPAAAVRAPHAACTRQPAPPPPAGPDRRPITPARPAAVCGDVQVDVQVNAPAATPPLPPASSASAAAAADTKALATPTLPSQVLTIAWWLVATFIVVGFVLLLAGLAAPVLSRRPIAVEGGGGGFGGRAWSWQVSAPLAALFGSVFCFALGLLLALRLSTVVPQPPDPGRGSAAPSPASAAASGASRP